MKDIKQMAGEVADNLVGELTYSNRVDHILCVKAALEMGKRKDAVISELQAEITNWKLIANGNYSVIKKMDELKRYAQHKDNCRANPANNFDSMPKKCTCGLEQALQEKE